MYMPSSLLDGMYLHYSLSQCEQWPQETKNSTPDTIAPNPKTKFAELPQAYPTRFTPVVKIK